MKATPIFDQLRREAASARAHESLDTADAHTLRTMHAVMCA